MNDDAALLHRFVAERSEEAFAGLVRRHLDLVYGAALRRTGGDVHAAADVAQQVFTALARQARALESHTVLSAWLHSATRNLAVNFMISEQRRKARERAAVVFESAGGNEGTPDWDQVRPVLDAAIDELPSPDRVAIILRFLERRAFADVGIALQVSADAARMRTERALEKLRTALERRGITSTAAALGTLVSAHSSMAAPAGLAATLAPAAFGATKVSVGAGLFLMSTKTVATVAGFALALGLGFYLGLSHSVQQPLPPLPATPEQIHTIASLRQENLRLKAETERLKAANVVRVLETPPRPAPAVVPTRPAPPIDPARVAAIARVSQQTAILNNLRHLSAACDQFIRENGRAPSSLDELVGPSKLVKALVPVAGESYAALALGSQQPLSVPGPDGSTLTYDPAGPGTTDLVEAKRAADEDVQRLFTERFGREFNQKAMRASIQKAGEAYQAANPDKRPTSTEDLLPYFASPQEGADFVEFTEVMKVLGGKM